MATRALVGGYTQFQAFLDPVTQAEKLRMTATVIFTNLNQQAATDVLIEVGLTENPVQINQQITDAILAAATANGFGTLVKADILMCSLSRGA